MALELGDLHVTFAHVVGATGANLCDAGLESRKLVLERFERGLDALGVVPCAALLCLGQRKLLCEVVIFGLYFVDAGRLSTCFGSEGAQSVCDGFSLFLVSLCKKQPAKEKKMEGAAREGMGVMLA